MSNPYSRRPERSVPDYNQPTVNTLLKRSQNAAMSRPTMGGKPIRYHSLNKNNNRRRKGSPLSIDDPSSDMETSPPKKFQKASKAAASDSEEEDIVNISQEDFNKKKESPVRRNQQSGMFKEAARSGKYKTGQFELPGENTVNSRPNFNIKRVLNRPTNFEVKRDETFDKKRGHRTLPKPKTSTKKKDDLSLDDFTEEEKQLELQSQKRTKLSKLAPPSSVTPDFMTAKIKKGGKENKQPAPQLEFTEEESKLTGGSKFSKLLESTKAKSDSFLKGLQKSKVTKSNTPELEEQKSFVNIDIDESFDTGLNNTHEEFNEARNFKKQRSIVEKRYQDQSFPITWDEEDIIQNTKPYLSCVPKILSGALDSPYYAEASDIAKASKSTHLSSSEFLKLPINHFTIGFYGIKRQAVIASIIKQHYQEELEKAQLINKTMKFWSLDSFVLYVLSCEIAVRMAAKDLKITAGEALDVLEDTVDYGKYITDPVPVKPVSKVKRNESIEVLDIDSE